jgi:hypothetical protein
LLAGAVEKIIPAFATPQGPAPGASASTAMMRRLLTFYADKNICSWSKETLTSLLAFIKKSATNADLLMGIPDDQFDEIAPMLAAAH